MVGTVLGDRYELIEKVGSGGMAEVYKAKCRLLNRYVAVKVLRPEFVNDEEFLSRFKIEAQAAASLSHQNIVSIYDVGSDNGNNYIVMEYVEGITLKQYIKEQGMLEWREAIDFSVQILKALEHAHKNGIVHRDIKPHNIIITPEKILKVTDFGIARAASSTTLTISGTTIGSVHYFSPEQARGGYTDAKSDIYSMGIVMYEMLTGRVPFDGDSPIAIAIMQIQNTPPLPREYNISIPAALEAIVLKAIKKDQDSRYQTASVMIADLIQVEKNPDLKVSQEADNQPTKKMNAVVIPDEGEVQGENNSSFILDEPPEPYVPRSKRVQRKTAPTFQTPEEEAENKSKKKTVAFGVATAVVLVALISYSLWLLLFDGVIGKEIEIPNLVGQNVYDVMANYKDAEFDIEIVQRVHDPVVEKDIIISQDPAAGLKRKGNVKIEVVVSDGVKLITLESYKGKEEREVIMQLEQQGLKANIVKKKDNNMAIGYVIETSPSAGSVVKMGSEITVYVSEGGGGTVVVPKLVGLTLEQAKREIQQNDLILGSVGYQDSTKPANTVLIQSISAGNEVEKFTQIDILVSSGKESGNQQAGNNNNDGQLKTKIITFTIPQDRETTHVKVVAGGVVVYQGTHKKSDIAIDVPIRGRGKVVVDLYYDGVKVKSDTYDL